MSQGVAGMGWRNRCFGAGFGRPLLASMTALSLSGCGAYLHDAGLQTSTSGLKTTFESLKAPEMFAELEQRQKAFSAEEDSAVAQEAVTARNAALLGFVRTPSVAGSLPAPRSAMNSFAVEAREELARIYGGDRLDELDDATLNRLFNAPDLEIRAARYRSELRPELAGLVADFEADRKQFNDALAPGQSKDERKTDCKSVLGAPESVSQVTIELRYRAIRNTCAALQQAEQMTPGSVQGLLASAASDSKLGAVAAQLDRLNSEKSAAEEQKRALLAAIAAIENKSRAAGSTLATVNQDIETFNALLKEASPYAKQAGLEAVSELIEDLLAAELKPDEVKVPSDTTIRGAAALQMLRAVADANDTFAGRSRVARTNELLLAAARARHDLRMVQVAVARDQALRQNYEAQALALLTKAAHLARVVAITQRTPLTMAGDFASARSGRNPAVKAAAGEAMASYLGAWNYGEIPYRVLLFRNIQVQRASALEAAKLTEEDYRTTLKPVFDELAAYGDGGIKPETIVELLGQLGVAGAILGE